MKITGIIWLSEVVDKIQSKHRVEHRKLRKFLQVVPKLKKMRKGRFRGEDVYRALGRTEAGRYLTVFFVLKRTGEALILSARDMDRKERRSHAKN